MNVETSKPYPTKDAVLAPLVSEETKDTVSTARSAMKIGYRGSARSPFLSRFTRKNIAVSIVPIDMRIILLKSSDKNDVGTKNTGIKINIKNKTRNGALCNENNVLKPPNFL
jgi:hypothetical protein